MNTIKSIHFVGIKGVGMTPLAIIAKEAGIRVTGCDIPDEFITDTVLKKHGIVPFSGFSKGHLQNVDLVITTGAHGGFDNKEVKAAQELKMKVITQGEAVGLFMQGDLFRRTFEGVSVAGSHGKTTTVAMVATIFKEAGLDPSYLVGTSDVFSLGSCGHFGKGNYFIAEADEYVTDPIYNKKAKFLWQHPKILLFTNIEFDHPDCYKSIDEIRSAFLAFAHQLPENGILIANGDDPQIQKLLKEHNGKVVLFGLSPLNTYILSKVHVTLDQTFFWVDSSQMSLGEFTLNVAGEHNAHNALGAILVAIEAGLSLETIRKGLLLFRGTKRRSEFIGNTVSGAYLFDDYAHHPTEIKKTLAAFKQRFPKQKLVCIFQPHTYSRTKYLFDEFISSFNSADIVIVTEIYPSLREKPDSSISSKLLVEKINRFHKNALFLPALSNVVEYVDKNNLGKDSIIITMGAGDIYKIHGKLKIEN